MITLAIETSCDETSAAVLEDERVLSNIVSSQLFHSGYGGVIPEAASREHLRRIIPVTEEALRSAGVKSTDVNITAATYGPGLIGALLVGLNFAKAFSSSMKIPFVPVNHIRSHLYSNFLTGQIKEFPFLGLIVSGGHTLLILVRNFFEEEIIGSTIDDAAGEAFDKVSKLMGLGYPGGPVIDRLALKGNPDFRSFPVSRVKDGRFDFSFSGIKTSMLYFLRDIDFEKVKTDQLMNDIAASFQRALVKDLYRKTLDAAKEFGVKIISVSGGVSANSELKRKFSELTSKGFKIYFPPVEYSTDNAAMIGLTGYYQYSFSSDRKYFSADSMLKNAEARIDYENF